MACRLAGAKPLSESMLEYWTLGNKLQCEILIQIYTCSFTKTHLQMSSRKWRPSCLGLSVLLELWLRSDFAIIMVDLRKRLPEKCKISYAIIILFSLYLFKTLQRYIFDCLYIDINIYVYMASSKTAGSPVHYQWKYHNLALSHWVIFSHLQQQQGILLTLFNFKALVISKAVDNCTNCTMISNLVYHSEIHISVALVLIKTCEIFWLWALSPEELSCSVGVQIIFFFYCKNSDTDWLDPWISPSLFTTPHIYMFFITKMVAKMCIDVIYASHYSSKGLFCAPNPNLLHYESIRFNCLFVYYLSWLLLECCKRIFHGLIIFYLHCNAVTWVLIHSSRSEYRNFHCIRMKPFF